MSWKTDLMEINVNILPEELRDDARKQIKRLETIDDEYERALGYYYFRLSLECAKLLI